MKTLKTMPAATRKSPSETRNRAARMMSLSATIAMKIIPMMISTSGIPIIGFKTTLLYLFCGSLVSDISELYHSIAC